VAGSISEDSSVATNLVIEILQKLYSPVLASKAKWLGKLENRPHPILMNSTRLQRFTLFCVLNLKFVTAFVGKMFRLIWI
jgi:hypothetical protein